MNGFIPNNPPVAVLVAAPAAGQAPAGGGQPPPVLMNGGIPNHQHHHHQQQQQQQQQQLPPQHPVAGQLVHYLPAQQGGAGAAAVILVQQPAPPLQGGGGGQPPPPVVLPQNGGPPNLQPPPPQQQQQMIPNGNVIQLAGQPQPGQLPQPQQQQQQHAYYNPRHYVQPVRLVNGGIPVATSANTRTRLIRTANGVTYATIQVPVAGNAGQPPGTTTLILTKQPPPKCILCCLACCGLESLWFNPNFHFTRVIALICNILVDLLMILCLLSTNWLTTIKYRQGLWQYCIDVDSPRPLPFGLNDHDGCHWGRDAAYIRLSGFFAVACFVMAVMATILTSLGLSSRDPNKKYTFYRFALYINLGALLAIIVSLTLYPAFFYSELHHTNMVPANRPHWYFGWAYGVGWGAAIFLVGAILLLVCDKETEEIYYQERTIVHAANAAMMHHHQQQQHAPLHNNQQHHNNHNHHHHHQNHNQSIKA